MTKSAVIEKSPMVREMEAALARYLAAGSRREKLAIEKDMAAIARKYRGRDAWQARLDADEDAGVPRATSRDRIRHTRKVKAGRARRRYPEGFDYKAAQAGDRNEDE
ncbi:MAG TPA: hypothetical protein VN654_24020 [Vicinamibacterales bacterium]|nr:hypothetical protein [Vicinamibacterales bacterium]